MTKRRTFLKGMGLLAMAGAGAEMSSKSEAQEPKIERIRPLEPARIQEIAALLQETPYCVGRPITDRAYWENMKSSKIYDSLASRVETLMKTPIPPTSDELFLEYSKNGNRTRWQNVANQRRYRLHPLVMAEALENQGRCLPAIEELMSALCAEKTWVLPAHDAKLTNFNGTLVTIDLASSTLAWNLALADYILGDKLKPATRSLLRRKLQEFIFTPYEDMIAGKRPADWWITTTNNWNTVCLAGVTGAALAAIPEKQRRALYVAAAERYCKNFLAGFTPDGYCSEGLGYWNYGFGTFIQLTENVRHSTGDKLDLLAQPGARVPAAFGARIQIQNGLSPAFADCGVFAKPDVPLMYVTNKRLSLGLPGLDSLPWNQTMGSLAEILLYRDTHTFLTKALMPPPKGEPLLSPDRTWFNHAGVLISRPLPGSKTRMGVALKGGNNNEHHNHNDLGSYVVALGSRPVLLDPGNEVYTARTFSSKRYDSKAMNSFGHPVPVIGGVLQKPGADSVAKILSTNFTPDADWLEMDITSAYPVKELKSIRRSFLYSRKGTGSLTVKDTISLSSPKTYETAVLTVGSWKEMPDKSLVINDVDQSARVVINTGGRAYTLVPEQIVEDMPTKPMRVGIRLTEPVKDAVITLTITPREMPPLPKGSLLRNGSFEEGALGWILERDAKLEPAPAGAKGTALHIVDDSKTDGVDATSPMLAMTRPGNFEIRGKTYLVSGTGIGVYVRYYDKQGIQLNEQITIGIAPLGTAGTTPGKWENFAYPFTPPPGTTQLQVWLHTFMSAVTDIYLDDLDVVEKP